MALIVIDDASASEADSLLLQHNATRKLHPESLVIITSRSSSKAGIINRRLALTYSKWSCYQQNVLQSSLPFMPIQQVGSLWYQTKTMRILRK